MVEDEARGKQKQTKICASLLARLLAKKDLSARDDIVMTGIEVENKAGASRSRPRTVPVISE